MCVAPVFTIAVSDKDYAVAVANPIMSGHAVGAEEARRIYVAATEKRLSGPEFDARRPGRQLLRARLDVAGATADAPAIQLHVDDPATLLVYERGPKLGIGDWLAAVPSSVDTPCAGAAKAAAQIDRAWRAGPIVAETDGDYDLCWAARSPESKPGEAPAPPRATAPADEMFAKQEAVRVGVTGMPKPAQNLAQKLPKVEDTPTRV